MSVEQDSLSTNANGGTELIKRAIISDIDPAILDHFQIFVSRVEKPLDPNKIRIYFAHDLAGDPAADNALANGGWSRFRLCVFVSNWQMQQFIARYNIPWNQCCVMLNAIEPIPNSTKPNGPLKLAYWATPHRGLDILVPVFNQLALEFDITLDVFSSYKLYGWGQRDADFEHLFQECRDHPKINYHGTVSNDELRKSLETTHIMAYPSTWQETSCICLMEAMSAGLVAVHPNLGALPETAANWTVMYQYQEDKNRHAQAFYSVMKEVIKNFEHYNQSVQSAASYANVFYNWNIRKEQWTTLLTSLLQSNR